MRSGSAGDRSGRRWADRVVRWNAPGCLSLRTSLGSEDHPVTAAKRENHDLCEYHAELAENQADIKESQAQIHTHLLWLRGAGRWGRGLLGGCFITLIGIGVT